MKDIIYLSFDDVLKYYCDTIEQSGGGMSGIREKSGTLLSTKNGQG